MYTEKMHHQQPVNTTTKECLVILEKAQHPDHLARAKSKGAQITEIISTCQWHVLAQRSDSEVHLKQEGVPQFNVLACRHEYHNNVTVKQTCLWHSYVPFLFFLREPSGKRHFLLAMKWLPCWKDIDSRSSTFVDLINWKRKMKHQEARAAFNMTHSQKLHLIEPWHY